MKNIFKSIVIIACLALSPYVAFTQSQSEKWSCEAGGDGLSHSMEITIENGRLLEFNYTSSVPAPSGDTYFNCSFSAERNSGQSEWIDSKDKLKIKMNDGMGEKDHLIVKRNGDSFTFVFKMSPSNCGHSTPFASKLTITKDKKICGSLEVSS